MQYEPMLTFNPKAQTTRREQMLEMYIEKLQDRVAELEQKTMTDDSWHLHNQLEPKTYTSKFVVLPVTYTSTRDRSPKLEIAPRSSTSPVDQIKSQVFETVV